MIQAALSTIQSPTAWAGDGRMSAEASGTPDFDGDQSGVDSVTGTFF